MYAHISLVSSFRWCCLFVLFGFFSILLILILHCLLLQTFRRPQFRVKDGKRVSRSVCLLACLFVCLIADFVLILCLFFCVYLLSCRFYFGFVCVPFTYFFGLFVAGGLCVVVPSVTLLFVVNFFVWFIWLVHFIYLFVRLLAHPIAFCRLFRALFCACC